MSKRQLYIGLMSGTSADGIDAALVDLQATPQLLATHSNPFPNQLRERILDISLPGENEIDRMGALDMELGSYFAECALTILTKAALSPSQIIAIGSHGQTIRHRPPGSITGSFTLQIGDPNRIAELTGITTVADFRRRDMAAGGQGAPLVPAFHNAIFHNTNQSRAIVNIGGMANITWLPIKGSVMGFDTGPGNVLMDTWIFRHLEKPFDQNGSWAASGKVMPELLNQMLTEPYFSLPAPKSTGREKFNAQWLSDLLQHLMIKASAEDIQATLLELTAVTICANINNLSNDKIEVLVCGGGAFNHQLMARITNLLPNATVRTTAEYGVDPQWIEAMAFAWLAKQTLERHPGNLCAVTGAKREVILGGVYFA